MSRLVDRVVWALTLCAAAALFVMMVATVVDILMRSLLERPIIGVFDLVEWMLVLVVFLGLPWTFLRLQQITVDVFDQFLPPCLFHAARIVGQLAALVLLGLLFWRMWLPAQDAYTFGDVKSDLGLPLTWFWGPMLLGIAFCVLAVVVTTVREVRALFRRGG